MYRPILAAASIPAILALVFLVQSDSPAPNVDAQDGAPDMPEQVTLLDGANVHLYQAGTSYNAAGQGEVTRISDSIRMSLDGDAGGSGSHERCGCAG